MFKYGSIEKELVDSMEKELMANQLESKYGFNKLAKAIDLLNAAASIFDHAGMHEQANEITKILQNLVK